MEMSDLVSPAGGDGGSGPLTGVSSSASPVDMLFCEPCLAVPVFHTEITHHVVLTSLLLIPVNNTFKTIF